VLATLAAGVAATAAGCAGPGQRAEDGAAARASKQPATLRISVDSETAKLGTGSFKDKHPHITVVLEEQVNTPGGANWRQKNFAEWMAGTGPDMTAACCAQLPEWGNQGLFTDLEGLIKRDAKQVPVSDYSADLLNTWKAPGKGLYALPSRAGIMVMYYSRTLFRREGIPAPDLHPPERRLPGGPQGP
jgi:ABC-type glycerol-3-phosphate transport system substrate-binding protein